MTRPLAALLCLVFVFATADAALAQGGRTGIRFGEDYPLGGKKMGDFKGKFTVLYFWDSSKKESVVGFKEILRLYKAYGKNEKFGGFVLFNLDAPATSNNARGLSKGLPFEQIFDGRDGPHNKNMGVKPEDTPVCSILNPDLSITWSDQLAKLEDELVKRLGAEKAAAPVNPDDETQAVASMNEAIKIIKERGEFTPAVERLAGLTPKMLNDPDVMVAATQVIMLMKLEKENSKGIERALDQNPKAKNIIRTISRKALAALNAPLPGDSDRATPTRPTTPSTGSSRDAIANRKLNAAEDLQLDSRDIEAYEQFKDIATRYRGTEAAKVATQHVADYEADPAFMKKYHAEAGEEKAQAMLRLARSYKQAGRTDLVRKTVADLLATYPDSAAAREAKAEGLNR